MDWRLDPRLFALRRSTRAAARTALLAAGLAGAAPCGNAMNARYLTLKTGAWRLALADLDGNGRRSLVCGAYDGSVTAVDPESGRERWTAPLGGFPLALAAGDIDADGRDEVFAACADGGLYALAPDGRTRWTFASAQPVQAVAVARLLPGGPPAVAFGGMDRRLVVADAAGHERAAYTVERLVHRLLAADLDGDGADELIVFDERTEVLVLKWTDGALQLAGRRTLHAPEHFKNWENPHALFFALSATAGDIDGDGRPEIAIGDDFHNRQVVVALGADLEPRWVSKPLSWMTRPDRWYDFYAAAFVRALPPGVSPAGVIAVSGGNVRRFDAHGELLGEAEAPVGFADAVLDGSRLYLGSTPNGDNTVYAVDLDGDWAAQVNGLDRRGAAAAVATNLTTLREQVLARPIEPGAAVRRYDVEWSIAGRGDRVARFEAWRREQLPHDGLRYIAHRKVIEETPPLDESGDPWNEDRWRTDTIRGTMTNQQIVATAQTAESGGRPTIFSAGHSCMPFITLDTAAAMLEAAPHQLVAFESAEDEDPESVIPYAEQFLGPLASLCRGRGARVIVKNKNVWWFSRPAEPRVFAALTRDGRHEATVPATEDSNSRTPELNLMARVGLRQAGVFREFQVSVHQDLFSFNRFHQWEYPKSGHPYLRLLVAHTVLGGSRFRAWGPFLAGGPQGDEWTTFGRESLETFLHLLGKGIVFPPVPADMAGLSTVGIAVHPPPPEWLADAHNGHRPWRWTGGDALERAVVPHNGCNWGMSPTPPHALQAVLFRKTRQFGCFVPPTPYGAVAIVPAVADLSKVAGVDEWWHTDGMALWREGGPRLDGEDAARELRASFEEAAERLPFRATGDDVFLHSVRMEGGRYRLYLIDPGWLDPRERNVRVLIQAPGSFRVVDVLAGEPLATDGRAFDVRVPAGALRILDARPGR
jgi:hypothetical protein